MESGGVFLLSPMPNIDKSTLTFIATMILLIGGVIYAAAQAWNGRNSRKSNEEKDAELALKLKEAANAALKSELERINLIVINQGKEIAALQAENRTYLKLLENRNPELETYMKDSMEFLKVISAGIKDILAKPTVAINNQPPRS